MTLNVSVSTKTPSAMFDDLPRLFNYALANSPADEVALSELMQAAGGIDCKSLDLPTSADALPHWQTMINRLLVADGKKWRAGADASAGFPPPSKAKTADKVSCKAWKDDFKALLDELHDNDKLRETYSTVLTLPQPEYEDEAWESLESLMRILLRAALEWKLVMVESGEVDYGEIAERAISALGSADAPSNLALRLDYRIQHLLVDEFQDTSHSQVRLLERLTAGWSDGDGRSLFLVGDPMQSIYRFRKAEVSLFIEAWNKRLLNHIDLQCLRLTVNFRSTRPVVDWVNQTFPQVMPRQSDAVVGAVHYSKTETRPAVTNNGRVDIQILPERDDEEEARRVIEAIKQCDADESIAILVRSRTHASQILTALDRLKQDQPRFRYQAINFTRLAETTLIGDLVSLTLALLQPADRLAWLATLRTPYIGLDLADLDTLVAGEADSIILNALTSGAQGDLTALSADGAKRLKRTGPILLSGVNQRGRQSVRSLVESTWIRLGGPACVENESEMDDASTYFDLLDSLEAENLPIDRDTLDQRLENLYAEPDANASDKLQVLTIYSAKGLQFDTVILPGLNRAPAGDKPRLLHWFELAGVDKFVLSPMRNTAEKEKQKKSGDLIKFINDVEKQRQNLENGRLLYVATTRAVHTLHLFAAIKPNAKGEIKPVAASLMSVLWPAIQSEHAPLISAAAEELPADSTDKAEDDSDLSALNLSQDYRRFAADWQLPVPADPVQVTETESMNAQSYIEFSWAGENARLAGNLVHRILQHIGELGIDDWQSNGGASRHHTWCLQQLASVGVLNDKAETITKLATRAIENCLTSRQGKWILQDHEDARCEYAITAVLDKQPRNLVLDRTFVEDGIRWIIDYKTSSHSGGDLQGFLENEASRYRDQLQRYKAAMAITETRPIKTALYFPLLDRLVEL